MSADADIDPREFRAAFDALVKAATDRGNPGSYRSETCRNCTACTFSEGCRDCHACNYAVDSEGCSHCTKIRDCAQCHGSSQLVDCQRCVDSDYLEHCRDCAECTYCFGCVGLVRKEFHILNQPYDRKTYFKMVKALRGNVRV